MTIDIAKNIWLANGLPPNVLNRLRVTQNPDPVINSSFKLGTAAQTTIGLAALSAAHFHSLRTGVEQDVTVDARHAVLEFYGYYQMGGKFPTSIWDSIAGLYKTKDNNHVRIHTNFPHHRAGILDILDIPASETEVTREIVAEALSKWDSKDFENVAADHGMCATAMRSFTQWDLHPQAQALLDVPPVTIKKIGEAPKRQVPVGAEEALPLSGMRILDLTRVLAGPVCGRTLAMYGGDVLWITSPQLPSLPVIDVDTSRGKRTTQLDLNMPTDRSVLRRLAEDADVFLQAYRPGGLDQKGFGVEELAKIRPGIVCANLRAWGWNGPWSNRRAFDSLVQTATGFNVAEGEAYAAWESVPPKAKGLTPRPLPMQALDHAAGYFLAFGINAALCKTMTEGGSWEVQVSLAAVGQWIRELGRIMPQEAFGQGCPFPTVSDDEVQALMVKWPIYRNPQMKSRKEGIEAPKQEEFMMALKHAGKLRLTPAKEGHHSFAPLVLNAHAAEWTSAR